MSLRVWIHHDIGCQSCSKLQRQDQQGTLMSKQKPWRLLSSLGGWRTLLLVRQMQLAAHGCSQNGAQVVPCHWIIPHGNGQHVLESSSKQF